jgi:hypothetical protein
MKEALNRQIIIKKDKADFYLFLQDKKGNDIFINGNIARLELKKSTPIFDTLNSQIGTIQLCPSKKEFRMVITRYAGETETYKMVGGQEGLAFDNEFGYWKVDGVGEQHLSYLLETIYYQLKEDTYKQLKEREKARAVNEDCLQAIENGTYYLTFDKSPAGQKSKDKEIAKFKGSLEFCLDKIKEVKEKLLGFFEWELDWEKRYRRNNKIYRTNPYHVDFLKKTIKQLKEETK